MGSGPAQPYQALDLEFQPDEPARLLPEVVLANLRRARKGAAPGLLGLTAEVARLLLDDEEAPGRFVQVLQLVAVARIPREAARAVALLKPNVVGSPAPSYQFGLSSRAGTESVVHLLTAALESNPEATLLSVDGVGAFDTISRQSMLGGLLETPGASRILLFVRMFCSEPSEYVWHDANGVA